MEFAIQLAESGAGELVINSVDNDGRMQGYDLELIKKVIHAVAVPVIALGGASSNKDLHDLVVGGAAAAAGSLFVFNGVHRAVLINYPTEFVASL